MNGALYQIAIWLIPLVIAIVFHEVAHGYVARMLGDRTAAERGRLTLNPIRHVDPVGTLLVPMMLALANAPIFGWAKPVPVVTSRLNHPRRDMALVALAGPGINLVMATIAAAGIGVWVGSAGGLPQAGPGGFVAANVINFLLINVFLAIFNLLPVPPFDGGHVVEAILPPRRWACRRGDPAATACSALCQAQPSRLSGHAVPARHPADDRSARGRGCAGRRRDCR